MNTRAWLSKGYFLVLSAYSLVLSASLAWAQVPHLIRYQGRAVDNNPQGPQGLEGPHNLTFKLCDSAAGDCTNPPNLLWQETHNGVVLTKGHFSVLLGAGTPPSPLNVNWGSPCWLSISIDGGSELLPRQQLTSVPLAITAQSLSGVVTTVGSNVGIGTTSPGSKLHVESSGSGVETPVRFLKPGLLTGEFIDFHFGKAAADGQAGAIGFKWNSDNTSSFVWLTNYGDRGSDQGVGLVVKKGGNVGIGTTSPVADLQIGGQSILQQATPQQTSLARNVYHEGGWKYVETGNGVAIELEPHGLSLVTIPPGTAGSVAPMTRRLTISNIGDQTTGNILLGSGEITNILTVQQNSMTDPIADDWLLHPSDSQHKSILRTLTSPQGYLDEIKAVQLYEWKRRPLVSDEEASNLLGIPNPTPEELQAKRQELVALKERLPKFTTQRVGIMLDDANVPSEILVFNPDGTKAGIDLGGYVGYLHAALKEAAQRIEALEAQVNGGQ